jgi:prefoldin subunit 2
MFMKLIDLEVQQNYSAFQSDLQALASKIGELEQEAEEHGFDLARMIILPCKSE